MSAAMQSSLLPRAVLGLSSVVVAYLVNTLVPEPYLDEIFHIPQAQRYCTGDFTTWDPKITTPPGLYLLSTFFQRLVHLIWNVPCDPAFLRSTNLILLLVLPDVFASILSAISVPLIFSLDDSSTSHLVPPKVRGTLVRRVGADGQGGTEAEKESARKARSLEGVIITSLPVLWFFGYLYYTDVASLAAVLVCQALALRENYKLAALFALLSLTCRQTNVIWVAFVAATAALKVLHRESSTAARVTFFDIPAEDASWADIPRVFVRFLTTLIHHWRPVLPVVLPFVPVFVAFGAFVVWNGGVVLGDKANHVPVLHVPQLFYFIAFTTFFAWPHLLEDRRALWRATVGCVRSWRNALIHAVLCAAIVFAIHRYTYEHPFLLADNRHYAFYVWRKLIKRHWAVKYLLAPVYLVCGRSWWIKLGRSQSLLWMLGFLVALFLTLAPSPLLEPRYFLIPYILLRLHIASPSRNAAAVQGPPPGQGANGRRSADGESGARPAPSGTSPLRVLAAEGCFNVLINVATMYLFLFRPFKWPSEDGWQRFMY